MASVRRRDRRLRIPARFRNVRYDGSCYPGRAQGLERGANCQHFAYEFLRHHGFEVPNLHSSELWTDAKYSTIARRIRPLDLILFNRTRKAWGAHVGVYLGDKQVLHLCKSAGCPEIWTLDQFAAMPAYRVLVGIKRFRSSANWQKGAPDGSRPTAP
ncbi:MAG: NlpC/P60 family protein [Candidatus Binataceae bacterium]